MDAELIRGSRQDADPDPDEPYVRFESRISIGDVADLVVSRATRSIGAQAIAGFLLAFGLVGAFRAVIPELWVPSLLLGAGIGTGLVLLPFIWWQYLSLPDLLVVTVEADLSGMIIHVADRQLRRPWAVYRTAQETSRLFVLTSREVRPEMFTKHDLPEADASAFRTILERVELLREMDTGPRSRRWFAFLIGAVGAIATLLVAGAFRT